MKKPPFGSGSLCGEHKSGSIKQGHYIREIGYTKQNYQMGYENRENISRIFANINNKSTIRVHSLNDYFFSYLPMYKKFLLKYKMFANDRGNCFTICIDGKSNEDFESKKMDIINKIKNIPMEAKDFSGNPLYGFGKIPYSISIL